MNVLMISGTVIKIETRKSPSGKMISHLTVKSKNDFSNKLTYFSCVAFDKIALYIQKVLKKGGKVMITATVQNDNYEKDGVKIYAYDFVVRRIEELSKQKSNTIYSGTKSNLKI